MGAIPHLCLFAFVGLEGWRVVDSPWSMDHGVAMQPLLLYKSTTVAALRQICSPFYLMRITFTDLVIWLPR